MCRTCWLGDAGGGPHPKSFVRSVKLTPKAPPSARIRGAATAWRRMAGEKEASPLTFFGKVKVLSKHPSSRRQLELQVPAVDQRKESARARRERRRERWRDNDRNKEKSCEVGNTFGHRNRKVWRLVAPPGVHICSNLPVPSFSRRFRFPRSLVSLEAGRVDAE